MDFKKLFLELYNASTETEVEELIQNNQSIFNDNNWAPMGGNESNYGIIENQQSNPIAALVEKVTNSIDAILTKKCLESGVQPDGPSAPKSMSEAVNLFFQILYKEKYVQWMSKTLRLRLDMGQLIFLFLDHLLQFQNARDGGFFSLSSFANRLV